MAQKWQLEQFGRENLQLVDFVPREPGPTEIMIRVKAASLNHRDLLVVRNGSGRDVKLPLVPGSDMSGEVIALGTQVQNYRIGDHVLAAFWVGWVDGERPKASMPMGGPGPGVFATHVTLEQESLVHAPAGWSHPDASTLPAAGLTAWTALVDQGHLRAGQTVLLHGTGGVSLFGALWAQLHGARAIVVTSNPAKAERIRELRVEVVLRDEDWVTHVRELTKGRGVDHVLETVGGENLAKSVEVLASGGNVYVIGMLAGTDLRVPFQTLVGKQAHIHGLSLGHRRNLEELVRAAEQTTLRPVISHIRPLRELQQALDDLEGGAVGKVILQCDDQAG